MRKLLRRMVSKLSVHWQNELKRLHFGRQIKKGRFRTDEKEFSILEKWVTTGDWVLDIGANVGHYTVRLSEIVGIGGRVIAFEPVPETFELLAGNVARLTLRNVTLLNVAVSDSADIRSMDIPKFDTGLDNYYMAHLTEEPSSLQVLCQTLDGLSLPHPIKLAKIDAEGHELSVLKGMNALLNRDHPTLIVEDNSTEVILYLKQFGYSSDKFEESSNRVFQCLKSPHAPFFPQPPPSSGASHRGPTRDGLATGASWQGGKASCLQPPDAQPSGSHDASSAPEAAPDRTEQC